ncbi:L-type lectin-domain containing receptor kinase V.5-like [Lingula anatina]|uniref:L-type lectin-domain containing receptor kinase V.5-like n=1 Tax=Lingula anatina TaxID=7574 RepID=A0A1S3JQT5_LINAN|nr:L-type lectin-domain containing receptor kinase V.5-like [Lingula anatina]|eukprot:XP_013412717.2 L-type lectin-domain containing receptor kinase V.5-like [Lingula anatina]
MGSVEDEFHFMMICPSYAPLRAIFLNQVKDILGSAAPESISDLFITVLQYGPVLEYMSVSEMERYCSNNSLGKSRFGEVFEGLEKYRQKEIAVEVCQKAREEHELQFIKERTIGYIRHPFLLPLYAVAATPEKIYLMYPYNMERRDLDHVLRNKSSELERHHRCRITYQVCGGLQYLHSPIERENVTIRNSILHMNIKPSHILLDQDWNARLRFHGPTAEVTSVDHSDQIYQDPDFLSSQGEYRKEYDVFSVGVVMWRLMGAEEEFLKEFRTEDGKFKLEEVTKKVIIKAQEALPAVWPICPEGESNYTTKFAKLALECVKPIDDRINLDDLRCLIKMNILDAGDKIDTFIKPSGTLCCKCNLNNAGK